MWYWYICDRTDWSDSGIYSICLSPSKKQEMYQDRRILFKNLLHSSSEDKLSHTRTWTRLIGSRYVITVQTRRLAVVWL